MLIGSVMREHGIGPCADDSLLLSSEDILLSPDTVEDIEVELAEVMVPYGVVDGISLSNQFADLSRTEEEDDNEEGSPWTPITARSPARGPHLPAAPLGNRWQ